MGLAGLHFQNSKVTQLLISYLRNSNPNGPYRLMEAYALFIFLLMFFLLLFGYILTCECLNMVLHNVFTSLQMLIANYFS